MDPKIRRARFIFCVGQMGREPFGVQIFVCCGADFATALLYIPNIP